MAALAPDQLFFFDIKTTLGENSLVRCRKKQ
jgi:hypothetical protein